MQDVINNLDINIKNKIKLNYIHYGVSHDSSYNKNIINENYDKLENIIKEGIINKKSYYEKCDKVIIDNYECTILKKDMNIYFILPGFITDKTLHKLREDKSLIILCALREKIEGC